MIQNVLHILSSSVPAILQYLVGIAAFGAIEWIYPAESPQSRRDKSLSFALSMIYFVTRPFVIYLPTYYISEPIIRYFGHPIFSADLDALAGTSVVAQEMRHWLLPFIPVFIADFFYYWMHRSQHTFEPLWAVHKLHHMEYSLCAITSSRHHWLESVLRIFFIDIPVAALFSVTAGKGMFLAILLTYWGFFIHANIRLQFGPLTRVFGGPQLHRLHHSLQPEHFDRNFAAFFPIWDILFGTYCHPKPHEWSRTGMADGERVDTIWRGLWLPFEGLWRSKRSAPTGE